MAKPNKTIANPLLLFPEFPVQDIKTHELLVLLKDVAHVVKSEVVACTRVYTDKDTTKIHRASIDIYAPSVEQPEYMTVALMQSSKLAVRYGCIRAITIDGTIYTLREITRNTYPHRGHRIIGCTCVVIGTRPAPVRIQEGQEQGAE